MGVLHWAVGLGRLDILYKASCLSPQLANPRKGHLQETFNIFGYLYKHLDFTLVLDDLDMNAPEDSFAKLDWFETVYGTNKEELPPRYLIYLDKPSRFLVLLTPTMLETLLPKDHIQAYLFLSIMRIS